VRISVRPACIDYSGRRTVQGIEQGRGGPYSEGRPFLVISDEISHDLDAGLSDMAADPATQQLKWPSTPAARFESVRGASMAGFAAPLHGKAQFHGGYDVIIVRSKAREYRPVQKINMDGRALGMVHGAALMIRDLLKFGFGQSLGLVKGGIISMRLV
jgi:hypothetical protein